MYVDEFTDIIKGLQDIVSSLHKENRELRKEIDIIRNSEFITNNKHVKNVVINYFY